LQAGLMGDGGQVVGQVAQVVLDGAEGLVFGQIDQAFGHAAQGVLGGRPQLAEEFLDAGLAVIGGRGGGRSHGACPGAVPSKRFGFPIASPSYHGRLNFSPTFAKHTR
jgi:hypothetical protein